MSPTSFCGRVQRSVGGQHVLYALCHEKDVCQRREQEHILEIKTTILSILTPKAWIVLSGALKAASSQCSSEKKHVLDIKHSQSHRMTISASQKYAFFSKSLPYSEMRPKTRHAILTDRSSKAFSYGLDFVDGVISSTRKHLGRL